MFTEQQITQLLSGVAIEPNLSFKADDDDSIRAYYEPLIQAAERLSGTSAKVEWNHYGSGYASFVDAWFYPSDGSARLSTYEQHHAGIWVLLSRTTRYFALGQGDKTWSPKGGSSYMPCFDEMDRITHPALTSLVAILTEHFQSMGMKRLYSHDLATPLPEKFGAPGILSEPPFHEFDALFHWED